MHLLSAAQYHTPRDLEQLFSTVRMMEDPWQRGIDLVYQARSKVMAIIKDEGSTRTRVSFEVAMQRLGGTTTLLDLNNNTLSIAKGETIEDTVRVVSEYVDVIVLRHSQQGVVASAASKSMVPVINAGDGDGEHPTQALLDMYTIQQKFPNKNQLLNIVLAGDLHYGRTVHSLVQLLAVRGNCHVHLMSPATQLALPNTYYALFDQAKISYEVYEDLTKAVTGFARKSGPDIIYMTRLQTERITTDQERNTIDLVGRNRRAYCLDEKLLSLLGPQCVILHPLPRCEEVPVWLDKDHRTCYFLQAKNGMYVRMALLYHLFNHGTFFPV